ncbi:hypothetical protein ACF08M_29375 [Streptomyces sp. NPDC015032]|uniref:hypothetical protein n=1 Tax=Streptomyces sp. NPDC015032 TaxID=3364937 RepID=UPI0036FBAA2E
MPVPVTALEQLQKHGAGAVVRRRLGREGEQWLTAALDNLDSDVLCRRQTDRADAEEERCRAAEPEARRACSRCGAKLTDQRWEETATRGYAWRAGDPSACGSCHADDVARDEAAAAAARRQAAAPPEAEPAPLPFSWPRNGAPGPRVRYGCVPPVEVDDLGGVAAGLRGTA